MNILSPKKSPIFVLVRFWQEDNVWNGSALDIPVAVSGESFEDVRNNFEEALKAHFDLLQELKREKPVINKLIKVAKERGFYDRIQPRETFEKFAVERDSLELCHA